MSPVNIFIGVCQGALENLKEKDKIIGTLSKLGQQPVLQWSWIQNPRESTP